MKKLITLTLLFALAVMAQAATYHVATTGVDTDPGSAEKPFATIGQAGKVLLPGDTCIVHGGVYREMVRPAVSGEQDKPITFTAAPGEVVTIDGTDIVTGWEAQGKGVLKAPLDWATSDVFQNEQMMTQARYPNTGADLLHASLQRMFIEAPLNPKDPKKPDRDSNVIAIDGLTQPKDAWKGAKLWVIAGNRWVAQTATIIASTPARTVSVDNADGTGKEVANIPARLTVDKKSGWWRMGVGNGYITGCMAALDDAREWYQEDNSLYLIPSLDVKKAPVSARKRDFAFDLKGLSYVTVSGFRIFATSVNMDEAKGCVLDNCQASYVASSKSITGGFNRDRAVNAASEGLGIIMGGSDNLISNCTIAYSPGDGISIWGKSNRVTNCVVHDCNYSGTDCAPISVTGTGHTIEHSTLYNGGRSIIVMRYLQQGKISYNHLYNAGLLTRDLGMVYSFTTDSKGTEISYNLVHDNMADGWGCVGIYLDNQCSNYLVHHNVIWNVSEAIALNQPSYNNSIYNNTCVGMRASIGCAKPDKGNMKGTVFLNNLFPAVTGIDPDARQENNITYGVDPRFVNPLAHDYRLLAGSPGIDAGQPIPGITDGFIGPAPDCGAYESGAPMWTAGAK